MNEATRQHIERTADFDREFFAGYAVFEVEQLLNDSRNEYVEYCLAVGYDEDRLFDEGGYHIMDVDLGAVAVAVVEARVE